VHELKRRSFIVKPIARMSPRAQGRVTGAFYLAIFAAGLILMALVPSTGLLNTDDAAAIDYIVSHQTAFWAGYPFLLLVVVFRLIVMLLFYELFKPVNPSISLLAVYFNLPATTLQAVTGIFLVTPLVLLGGAHDLTPFTPDQLHALALVAMALYHVGYVVALALFGCYDLLIGYLAFQSTFIPRPIGVLMMITGLGWLTFLVPPLATDLLPYSAIIAGIVGEGAMILWLLAMGVDSQRWNEQAGKAAEPDPSVREKATV
jgi:hypothetical protein